MATTAPQPRLDLAIATLSIPLRKDTSGHGGDMCGLVKWCSQAKTLVTLVPRSEILILTPEETLADCPNARLLAWDADLSRKLRSYTERPEVVPRASERPWLAAAMQKIQLLALGHRYRSVLISDWDVELVPDVTSASRAWATHFPAFLRESAPLLIGSPDVGSPLNAGVLLGAPSKLKKTGPHSHFFPSQFTRGQPE